MARLQDSTLVSHFPFLQLYWSFCRFLVTEDALVQLLSLIAQAHFGNYDRDRHGVIYLDELELVDSEVTISYSDRSYTLLSIRDISLCEPPKRLLISFVTCYA
jgi:hypothetical protein